jgi:hypothetical protein
MSHRSLYLFIIAIWITGGLALWIVIHIIDVYAFD